MSEVELLPCPFCGNTDLNEGHRFPHGSSIREPAVRCSGCGVQGPRTSWNTRAPSPELATAQATYLQFCKKHDEDKAKLRAALQPFASSPYATVSDECDDYDVCQGIKVSDLKTARTALKEIT